jgi:hypothetical protein
MNFPEVWHENFRLLGRDSSPPCHRDLQKKLIQERHNSCNVFTAIEVSIELRHGQVCEVMVQEKERMQRHQLCEIRHFTVKPIPTPLAYSSSLFCISFTSASALARVRLCKLGVQFTSFHSGSIHGRWRTLQGAELDMNVVFLT